MVDSSSDEDLMSGAASSTAVAADKKATKSFAETANIGNDVDMMFRAKRGTDFPSFDDIYTFIRRPVSPASLSNELFDELTATETSSDVISNNDVSSNDDDAAEKHGGGGATGMKGIMSELKASKHHKLTRSDIRQLAKKAVILATLKKLKEEKSKAATTNNNKSPSPAKVTASRTNSKSSSSNKKHNNKKSTRKNQEPKRTKKKHHSEKHSHLSTTDTSSDSNDASVVPVKNGNEMTEDLSSHASKKSENDVLTDNDPALTDTSTSDSVAKKSIIGKVDDSVANMFDESSDTSKGASPSPLSSGKTQLLSDKVKSLRSFLVKADSSIIPLKFLPDLPSGLRMIGWKEMIDKKKKQLNELEATIGTVEDVTAAAETNSKQVSLNIDVDDPLSGKTAASSSGSDSSSNSPLGDLTELTADKKSEDPISLQHIGYLQRHIKGARSLRKLIARTLVGHCKSTGKRIFEAFVAMDKALARAQTIATVIGKKFNIDIDRIDALVGDKEDQVVETFLKDIFTKI